jgi:hypothetical protein
MVLHSSSSNTKKKCTFSVESTERNKHESKCISLKIALNNKHNINKKGNFLMYKKIYTRERNKEKKTNPFEGANVFFFA